MLAEELHHGSRILAFAGIPATVEGVEDLPSGALAVTYQEWPGVIESMEHDSPIRLVPPSARKTGAHRQLAAAAAVVVSALAALSMAMPAAHATEGPGADDSTPPPSSSGLIPPLNLLRYDGHVRAIGGFWCDRNGRRFTCVPEVEEDEDAWNCVTQGNDSCGTSYRKVVSPRSLARRRCWVGNAHTVTGWHRETACLDGTHYFADSPQREGSL